MDWTLKIRANKDRQKQNKRDPDLAYRQKKKYEFTDRDKIKMNKFFILPKSILEYGLSKAALAVYPVICSFANFKHNKPVEASQGKISKFAGISVPTVIKAVDELEGAFLLSKQMVNRGCERLYSYNVDFIRKDLMDDEKGNGVYFYTSIIESGIWANLKPRAKALYIAMRCNAKLDLNYYSLVMEDETGECYELHEFNQYLQNREWDVVDVSLTELVRQAPISGINSGANHRAVLDELEYHRLADRYIDIFRVWLKPKIRAKIRAFG